METHARADGFGELLRALSALRAPQWAHFVVLPLAGLSRAALGSKSGLTRGALGLAAASFSLAYAYGLNAVHDRASDASAEKNPLTGDAPLPSFMIAALGASAALALGVSVPLGARASLRTLVSLAAGTLYSAPPRLKDRPVLGLVANTAIFAPLLGLCVIEGEEPPAYELLAATFVGLLVQNQLLHEIADATEDAAGGAFTTARWLGPERARFAAAAVAVPFAVIARAVAPTPGLARAASLVLAAGAAAALWRGDPAAARKRHRGVAAAGGAILYWLGQTT
ncbi:UbiA family prenyltransferase [Polyangium jinanense]|uniref:UbiA family prenyltransferase n=1 Tax=Polyangium jinanense TaxID=2829994 RepID=A0A9X3XCQ1_9BACT|nr:UbiA family prenyltransferase [Polyangium jinanense]MDC3960138.1 UbiA family prenyltransferase [Polyangium jinanense]MDC3986578.1 UbiA family prenyltransferase [Polyangium jinanense]